MTAAAERAAGPAAADPAGTGPGLPAGALLRQTVGSRVDPGGHLWGFGGVHGGLALGLLTSAMRDQAGAAGPLRGVTGRFHRAIRGGFDVEVAPLRSGRALTTAAGQATSERGLHVEASAVFGAAGSASWPVFAPPSPTAPPPEDCELFAFPVELAPIGRQFEVRPVSAGRPYAGGDDPELVAWIRLVEDDEPPDPLRLVFLMDALAPSYTAVLSDLVLVPTVELSVRPADRFEAVTSPWVLLRARTLAATASGWHDEQIDAWSGDGVYLGSAHQLRLVREG